ncbi:type IV secretion system protein VirD4 (plasmid) [Haematobacter massiliensis]|nr:type IV secretion system protein VirD4 [Haematobacter massiliensis]
MAQTTEIAKLAGGGLLLGALLGVVAASGYVTWQTGGDLANIEVLRVFDFAPWTRGYFGEPFRMALYIGLGVMAALTVLVPAIGFKKPLSSHGTARWSTKADLKRSELLASTANILGPIYGKLGSPSSRAEFLSTRPGTEEIPHSIITAPTGSGKGIGIVVPTLLTYKGSVFCLDVKGENYNLTARRREELGDRVFKFAPYDDHGQTHRYNPLMYVVSARERRRFTEARRLAASLIIAKGNGEGFLEGARDVFAAGAILAIQRGTPTIAAVYDAFYATPGEAADVFRRLAAEVDSVEAKTIFNRMAGMESRILSSYLSVLLDGGLGLWADPAVREATEVSDFGIHDLRRDPASIFIIVSPNDLVPLAPLIRLMFQQTIAMLQASMPQKDEKFPVLLLLDEFVSLGRMDVLATAITTLRGFGGRVMLVVQSIASLRDLYGKEGASGFLANCRLQLFMAPADEDTPEYISRAIGDFTRKSRSKSWRSNEMGSNWQEREEGARLLRAEQVRMLPKNKIVVLVQGMPPIIADRVEYYRDRYLKNIYQSQTGPHPQPPSLYNDPPPALEESTVAPDDPPRDPPAPASLPLYPQDSQTAPAPEPAPAAFVQESPAEAVPAAPEEPKATPVANTTPAEREAETTPVLSPEKQGEEHHPSSQTPESNAGMETAKPVNDPNRPTTSLPEAVDEESVLSRLHAIEKRQGSLLGDLTAWRDKANSLAQANRNRESTSDMRAGEVQNAPEVRPVDLPRLVQPRPHDHHCQPFQGEGRTVGMDRADGSRMARVDRFGCGEFMKGCVMAHPACKGGCS